MYIGAQIGGLDGVVWSMSMYLHLEGLSEELCIYRHIERLIRSFPCRRLCLLVWFYIVLSSVQKGLPTTLGYWTLNGFGGDSICIK